MTKPTPIVEVFYQDAAQSIPLAVIDAELSWAEAYNQLDLAER